MCCNNDFRLYFSFNIIMIEINNIVKRFSKKNVLNDITFKIKKGASLAIIGQSGVGKSVLLKHLNGLIVPDYGNIIINKKSINKLSFSQLQGVRKKMSMVFQFGALFDSLTIKNNILIALDHLTNLSKEENHNPKLKSLQKDKKELWFLMC